ncbi:MULTISPECIES: BREX-1 system adenine-specific DNA-methyltransferase PglX [unclassified Phaeobacter]|uniref:BREX-1 system adenine-specific DNA-methyltransferase PglX n=1 Tax=unclassified Phaeobacter TaxID=2621772 RepID=UPI003A8455C3
MDTNALKKFAQAARNLLIDQVTSKLDVVLAEGSAARREAPKAIKDLENAINKADKQQVIEQVAYTWFNRFTALRFMDTNGYTQVRTVSPADGATRPELLSEAMAGNLPDGAPANIQSLLDGRTPSHDPQAEAYRLLLVHTCNQWHGPMPFLFEEIDDYTELLMPEDLLSQSSILAELRRVMTEDACQDVEIIGWLYQFYISEKKDQVFAGLKKNKKIEAENIPAATQLFTPHWIVRYLVENSLGRLWLLNRPQSRLADRMDYYIAPEVPETDFLKITRPEEIRICDPAAGSGHMLTYAFDLLYDIYEEEGYDATEIPALILANNLTGVEIDDRAGALAAFALAMKAAGKLGRRRFLRMEAKPDICVLQNVAFTEAEMQDVAAVVGKDLFTDELRETLGQFEQAKNFGSLIVPKLRDPAETLRVVEAQDFGGDLLLRSVQERVIAVLRMAEALSPKYHVVVANPPYKKKGDLNGELQSFLIEKFPDCFSDLYAAFIDRLSRLCCKHGLFAMIAMDSWLFGDDYTEMRARLISGSPFQQLAHLGARAFDEIKGEVVQVASFVSQRNGNPDREAHFFDLTEGQNSDEKASMLRQRHGEHLARASDFSRLPRNVVAYFVSDHTRHAYAKGTPLKEYAEAFTGLQTGDNPRFIRSWSEVNRGMIDFEVKPETKSSWSGKWVPYVKGSDYRKWYGNHEFILDWKSDGAEIKTHKSATVRNEQYYFRNGLAYNTIASRLSVRRVSYGHIFDQKNSMFFSDSPRALDFSLGFLHSNVMPPLLRVVAAKDFGPGSMKLLPVFEDYEGVSVAHLVNDLVEIARADWDAYETSWDFTTLPLLSPDYRGDTLEDSYATLRAHWQSMTDEMKTLEEENNRIFIDAYGLQDELTPEVPLNEITLTCNPAYRYGVKGVEADRETRLRADTMAEFLHYAVGCMFGRYSLDAPGLILANQGERLEDYLARIPEPQFMPDEDNVIPVLDADWFPDDITERFRLFLRTTFGEAHFRENLRYIEDALGKDIRKYFTKDFYADHVKRYKKRPIYWLFSSPKGTFNALIYMHRYQSDTVSVLLNDYLREFITKLEGERARLEKLSDDPTATQGQKTKALKDVAAVAKQIDELNEWERDVIFPLAQQKIEIDLDDGVKANYPKFGSALKKIAGLS